MKHPLAPPLLFAAGALAFCLACGSGTPAADVRPADAATAASTASAAAAPSATAAPAPPTAAPSAAPSAIASAEPAAEPPKPVVADNQVKPISDEPELAARAKGLLEAIASDDPPKGDAFWFPKEPFIPLKDIKDPGKYWEQLHRDYANDVHALHKKRKDWSGAAFQGFEIGSAPKWVKPGEEANKIGYYRSFHGKIHFEQGGEAASIDVHTIITWQGRWYVTHLSKFKK